jgi:hypothetical protein
LTGKGRVEFSEALDVARDIIKTYTEDTEIDKVFLIYNEFKSVLSQRVVLEQLLPVSRAKEEEPETKSQQPVALVDYIYEQPPEVLFGYLLPRLIETQIFRALLESVASEHGARMTAMDSASKNASELIESVDAQHESHTPGSDYQRDYRSCFWRRRTVATRSSATKRHKAQKQICCGQVQKLSKPLPTARYLARLHFFCFLE